MEKTKTVEILFPEFCNLYGDISNIKYLKKCIPEANFIETSFCDKPAFVSKEVNLIYMGPMTEKMQEKVIKKLKPYKEKIEPPKRCFGGSIFKLKLRLPFRILLCQKPFSSEEPQKYLHHRFCCLYR